MQMTAKDFKRIMGFGHNKETPFLLIDINIIREKMVEFRKYLPSPQLHYPIKANPLPDIIRFLDKEGTHFEIASIYELKQLLELGIDPGKISYGNTIKKANDIKYAFQRGVRLFCTDCESDLENLVNNAPGSKVYYRLNLQEQGSPWLCSQKFGAPFDKCLQLISKTRATNLIPYGISFHVGSQQEDIEQWYNAIKESRKVFDQAAAMNIDLKMLNLGGGFPADYLNQTIDSREYLAQINSFLQKIFPENLPDIVIEPGRGLVGNSGTIVSEVIKVERKTQEDPHKWLYLDIGVFSGLIETINEITKYPIVTDKEGETTEYIVAGPTCDGTDIIYKNFKYTLPKTLQATDRLYIRSTGAYTHSYSSISFNGFPPLKAYILD